MKFGNLSAHYLKTPLLFKNKYDDAYGIKTIQDSHRFKIGREEVTIDGNDSIIGDKRFYGTAGLWKLLTLKDPGNVPFNDLEVYKEIIMKTKAFFQDGKDRVNSNSGSKYKKYYKTNIQRI